MSDLEKFLVCLKSIATEMKDRSVYYIKDKKNAIKFLSKLEESHILLGMDLYDGTCSGRIKIKCDEAGYIKVEEDDNGSDDIFKLRSIIIIISNLSDNDFSPTILFEADEDIQLKEKYEKNGYPYIQRDNGIFLELEIEGYGEIESKKSEIEEYLNLEDLASYDEDIYVPQIRRRIRHFNKGINMYVNIQKCNNRADGRSIMHYNQNNTSEKLIKSLEKNYNIITL